MFQDSAGFSCYHKLETFDSNKVKNEDFFYLDFFSRKLLFDASFDLNYDLPSFT